MKTFNAKPETVKRDWCVIDADNKVLGRLATEIARRLRGIDTGDYIIVINVEKVHFTGRKEQNKAYYYHTGYPGGLKSNTVAKIRESHPERLLQHAVKGMLPKGPLGREMFRKLKIYVGSEHKHSAQQPTLLVL